jgi:V-type H+-transporting ATPase subunit H
VACHDIAQFIQLHPAGRGIILDLKAKERVMKHMSSPDPEVAKQALLCVQKILLSAKQGSFFWLQNTEGEPVVGVFATNLQP